MRARTGLDVRHQGGDLFGRATGLGTVLDSPLDVGRTVFVRDRQGWHSGLDDDQRVPEDEVGVVPCEASEPQVDMCFGDFGADGVNGGEVGIPHEERAVRQGLTQSGRLGGFRDA